MSPEIIRLIAQSTLDTLAMVAVAAGLGTLFGLPLGVFLYAPTMLPLMLLLPLLGYVLNRAGRP